MFSKLYNWEGEDAFLSEDEGIRCDSCDCVVPDVTYLAAAEMWVCAGCLSLEERDENTELRRAA